MESVNFFAPVSSLPGRKATTVPIGVPACQSTGETLKLQPSKLAMLPR